MTVWWDFNVWNCWFSFFLCLNKSVPRVIYLNGSVVIADNFILLSFSTNFLGYSNSSWDTIAKLFWILSQINNFIHHTLAYWPFAKGSVITYGIVLIWVRANSQAPYLTWCWTGRIMSLMNNFNTLYLAKTIL